jgi:hypothetical protein
MRIRASRTLLAYGSRSRAARRRGSCADRPRSRYEGGARLRAAFFAARLEARCPLVRAARRAARERSAGPRARALARAWRAKAVEEAASCPSRRSARSEARDRVRDAMGSPSPATRASLTRGDLDASPPRLREPDRDRLLRRAGAVLSAPDMVHLFPDILARLGGGRFSLSAVPLRSSLRFAFGHGPLDRERRENRLSGLETTHPFAHLVLARVGPSDPAQEPSGSGPRSAQGAPFGWTQQVFIQ